ncbi:MAG: hypothetical protein ABTQ24_00985, partial [Azonexus sp.]
MNFLLLMPLPGESALPTRDAAADIAMALCGITRPPATRIRIAEQGGNSSASPQETPPLRSLTIAAHSRVGQLLMVQ